MIFIVGNDSRVAVAAAPSAAYAAAARQRHASSAPSVQQNTFSNALRGGVPLGRRQLLAVVRRSPLWLAAGGRQRHLGHGRGFLCEITYAAIANRDGMRGSE